MLPCVSLAPNGPIYNSCFQTLMVQNLKIRLLCAFNFLLRGRLWQLVNKVTIIIQLLCSVLTIYSKRYIFAGKGDILEFQSQSQNMQIRDLKWASVKTKVVNECVKAKASLRKQEMKR